MSEAAYNIKFVGIELVSQSIAEPPSDLDGQISFTFDFFVELKLDAAGKRAGVVTVVTIFLAKENLQVASFKIRCVFEFPDFDSIFTKIDDGKYQTPLELEIILKSTGISTIRGVISCEVRGTYLQGAVLPLIDINKLVREQRLKNDEKQ